jgi:cystathionine gamma-lyase
MIHCGNEPGQEFGGVAPVLDFSSTFAQPEAGNPLAFAYSRYNNPTRQMLERNLAAMDDAKYSIAFSAGMSACITMLNTLKRGDHVLCVDDVYGGVQRFLRAILNPNSEVEVDFIDFNKFNDFKKALKPSTRIVWAESPTNPTLKCYDIKRIADHLKTMKNRPKFVVDNTFISSVWQKPLSLGADVVMHSASKSIGGHSDVIAGCL